MVAAAHEEANVIQEGWLAFAEDLVCQRAANIQISDHTSRAGRPSDCGCLARLSTGI